MGKLAQFIESQPKFDAQPKPITGKSEDVPAPVVPPTFAEKTMRCLSAIAHIIGGKPEFKVNPVPIRSGIATANFTISIPDALCGAAAAQLSSFAT